tara:strand:- start:5993 stop:6274 length:282 start_codon:yes stop_codon:yes gene_type:complete
LEYLARTSQPRGAEKQFNQQDEMIGLEINTENRRKRRCKPMASTVAAASGGAPAAALPLPITAPLTVVAIASNRAPRIVRLVGAGIGPGRLVG